MGLFSSEYKTTVGTTVSRVVKDNSIISSTQLGLVAGLFGEDDTQLIENILESAVGSMGIRAERMYSYAKANYPYGLPSSKVSTTTDGKSVVLGVLKSLTSPSITVDYYKVGPLNNLHVGWVKLVNDYGYNSLTNQLDVLSAQKGHPVYLKDMIVVIKEATLTERENGSLDLWGTSATGGVTPERTVSAFSLQKMGVPTPIRVDPLAVNDDAILVSYVWTVPTTMVLVPAVTTIVNGTSHTIPAITTVQNILHEEELLLPITGYDRVQDFFQIKYLHSGKDAYWLYQLGSGAYPEIDTIFDLTPTNQGEFFPFTYFRQGVTNMGTDKTAPVYKAANKMMKTLGINYQSVIDSIHENPDISKVEQALMMFAVSPNSTHPIEQRYLFDFFNKMYLAAGGIGVGVGWEVTVPEVNTDNKGYMAGLSEMRALNKAMGKDLSNIRITIQDSQLSTALSCQGLYKRKRAGVIAAVGEYASSFITENITYTYHKKELDVDVPYTVVYPVDSHIYKHQITDAVYEEIQVYDLNMTYYMWGGYSTVGEDQNPILLVPIDRAITKRYALADRELLYTRAMHYIFNSRTVTEVKWYQQTFFEFLMLVVAVVITFMTWDPELSMQWIALTAGTMTITQFAIYLAVTYLPSMLLYKMAFKMFVKAVGEEFAMLVAFVAAAYGSYQGFKFGSIKGAPWAENLLSLANGLSAAVNASMTDAMNGLKNEYDAFSLLAKERMSMLEDKNKLLDRNPILTPNDLLRLSPDDLYATVHYGNIGTLGIDSITSYVDIALTLPKFNETIGRKSYV